MRDTGYPVIFVTRELLNETAVLLASFAASISCEGVVYWFGHELGSRAVATTLVVPDAEPDGDGLRTSPEANVAATAAIAETPLVLLGQAHSHPRDKVRHSRVDDRETFACFDGALSIVVPFFGKRGLELSRCGVYRHMLGKFRCIAPKDQARHLHELPGVIDLRRPDRHVVSSISFGVEAPRAHDQGGRHVR